MLLKKVFFYAIFAVGVTVTCAHSDDQPSEELSDSYINKRLAKREAAIVVIDSFPGLPITSNKPKTFYKRISKQKYHYMPNRGPPRGKHGQASHSHTNKPHKKYKVKKVKPIYSAPSGKKRLPIPWQPLSSSFQPSRPKPSSWASYRTSKKPPMAQFPHPRPQRKPSSIYSPMEQEPMGFAEPPTDYRPIKQSEEIPVDSYGALVKINVKDLTSNQDPFDSYNIQDTNTAPDYINMNNDPQFDNNVAFSDTYQSLANPSVFENEPTSEDFNMNSFIVSKYNEASYRTKNNKNLHHTDMRKLMNRPWKSSKTKEQEDTVLVGGQYAEPPARYVPMFQPQENMFFEENDRFIPGNMAEINTEPIATVSPYVNYKNSNIAFSPQNLNDAFSIDK